MMLWREDEGRAFAVTYGMRAPAALNVADYPLTGEGRADDLFPWKAVEGDRNVQGATAVAMPGVVDGIGLAHGRFGTMPWADLLQPAVGLAREGMGVDWYSALLIAATARALSLDADAAAMFLEDGCFAPVAGWTALSAKRLDQSRLADTLDALARGGRREFFEGEVARALPRHADADGRADISRRVCRARRRSRAVSDPRRRRLRRLCPGVEGWLSHAPRADGRRRRTPGKPGLHHPLLRRGPPRKHGGGDADAALDLRGARCLAVDRVAAEQRHHGSTPNRACPIRSRPASGA